MDVRVTAPARHPNGWTESSEGFLSAKLQREVAFESRLELSFIEMLEASDDVLTYQEQPLTVDYHFGGRPRTYYPDFLVALRSGVSVLVEVKPLDQMALQMNLAKWRAALAYTQERGWAFLVTDNRTSLRTLLRRPVDPAFRAAVLKAIEVSPLSFTEYRSSVEGAGLALPPWQDFVALVVQERLEHKRSPFRLALSSSPPRGASAAFAVGA
jgi:hypothetical protein